MKRSAAAAAAAAGSGHVSNADVAAAAAAVANDLRLVDDVHLTRFPLTVVLCTPGATPRAAAGVYKDGWVARTALTLDSHTCWRNVYNAAIAQRLVERREDGIGRIRVCSGAAAPLKTVSSWDDPIGARLAAKHAAEVRDLTERLRAVRCSIDEARECLRESGDVFAARAARLSEDAAVAARTRRRSAALVDTATEMLREHVRTKEREAEQLSARIARAYNIAPGGGGGAAAGSASRDAAVIYCYVDVVRVGGQMFVQTITGRACTLNVPHTHTVLDIKRDIAAKQGTPVDAQRLIWSGRQLSDSDTVHSLYLEPSSTLHLVLRLRGGMYHESSGRHGFAPEAPRAVPLIDLTLSDSSASSTEDGSDDDNDDDDNDN